jgi:putative sporulation protein YyaC
MLFPNTPDRSEEPRRVRTRVEWPDCPQHLVAGFDWLWSLLGQPEIIVCIGTDRATGDAFGPLVGSRLLEQKRVPCEVLGTLDHPVHGSNLLMLLRERPRILRSRCLAIDASLGAPEDVGSIIIAPGSMRPGAGVQKELPAIGQYFVAATVNIGGLMDAYVLQNTRLSLVMRMAALVADALTLSLSVH